TPCSRSKCATRLRYAPPDQSRGESPVTPAGCRRVGVISEQGGGLQGLATVLPDPRGCASGVLLLSRPARPTNDPPLGMLLGPRRDLRLCERHALGAGHLGQDWNAMI